jgi:hypothetical protein
MNGFVFGHILMKQMWSALRVRNIQTGNVHDGRKDGIDRKVTGHGSVWGGILFRGGRVTLAGKQLVVVINTIFNVWAGGAFARRIDP